MDYRDGQMENAPSESVLGGQVLGFLERQLALLAEAWLSSGAKAYGVWEGGRPLLQWPDRSDEWEDGLPFVSSPIQAGDGLALELRVIGVDRAGHGFSSQGDRGAGPSAVEARLGAEAALVADVIQAEGDLDAVTARLIETQDQLLALYDLTRTARAHTSMQDALDSLVKGAVRLVKSEGALAILAMPDDTWLITQQPHAYLSGEQARDLLRQVQVGQQELLQQVMLQQAPLRVLLPDSGPLDTGASVVQAAPPAGQALFVIPVWVRGQVGAILALLNKPGEPFASPTMKLARTIAEQGGTQLENALLLQDTLAQARVQTEMELAKRVQLRLLPQRLPQVHGLALAAYARPAFHVGGDFYELMERADHRFTFAVGDVSGKGIAAALLMSMMHTAVGTIVRLGLEPTPAMIVAQTNVHLYDDLTEVGAFVTMFVGQYENATCRLTFANAGHSPVIYCPKGGPARLLEADGPGVGVLPVSLCQDQALWMRPGDLLFAATDGFSEAHNADGEMFGHERILELVERQAALGAPDLLKALVLAVDGFSAGHPQDDDQTAIVLKGVPA